ncbi:5476_t:CDS:2 [Funneliformis geosporum]|uniref:5476_t:CDS:1 n=1 Tax=Funneliformis geosporum TaxID=1117311 RepID=A0A9W4SU18_9GLOM|nr:5476_t:CDS:2 [Funneliformis geosporum]
MDAKINQKYCGSNQCKFLFAYHVPEQETSANAHFFTFIQLAEMLNRTIVLVNVQHSRLESCRKFPFNFYYNVDAIMKMFPNVKFITQQSFLDWTREHDLIINKTTFNIGSKYAWKERNNNRLMIKNLTRSFNLDDEVLLIRHQIPTPLFPSKGQVIPLPYANHLIEAANNATNQLKPFIAIHWRMETSKPEMMPICVKSLIKYINKLQKNIGIYKIYLATDYPLVNAKAQSSTFHIISEQHHDAIKLLNSTFTLNTWVSMKTLDVLINKFPEYKKEINEEFRGSGLQGIFDKLVMSNSSYFISGPKGCGYITSKFSKKISEIRRLMQSKDKNILNDITRWPLDKD